MERQRLSAALSRFLVAGSLLTLLLGASGCVTTEAFFAMDDHKPTGKVYQVMANWTPQVQFVPDTVHQGRPMPGIVGRLYLFGEQVGFPLTGEGTVHLELSAILPERPQDGWICLEKLDIDKESLKKLNQDDHLLGTGYTMYLPWWSYRPDVTQIQMTLAYTPEKGSPLYSTSKVSLNPCDGPMAPIDSRQELGDRRRYAAPVAQAPYGANPQPPNGQIQQANYSAPAPQPAQKPAPIGQQIWPPPQKSGATVTQTPWVPPGGWEAATIAPR
jgi:hypothetical protein